MASESESQSGKSTPSNANDPILTQDFIDDVCDQIQKGFGFLPLVGAGLSAPSGVPIINELYGYLKRCVIRALGIDHPAAFNPSNRRGSKDFSSFRRWIPGRDDWPRFCDLQLFERDTVNWEERLYQIIGELKRDYEYSGQYPAELEIFQEAYGAMADWRTVLLFLARLKEQAEEDEFVWKLSSPRPDVLDTFFLNVVLGKQTTLGHRMLARLADPLRIETILTTNFDDLMEQAFVEIGRALTVFDVHVSAGLPPYSDLIQERSLIKLHGGRYGLRADYSLDELPSDSDCMEFANYLAGRQISLPEWDSARSSTNNDKGLHPCRSILIAGVSARDQRVTRLLLSAISAFTSDLKIFWLCHTRSDFEQADSLRRSLQRRRSEPVSRSSPWFHPLWHQFLGLLFQQVYQHVTLTLPATGAMFPSAARLPVPQRPFQPPDDKQKGTENDFRDRLTRAIKHCMDHDARTTRLLVVTSKDQKTTGVMSCAAKVFEDQLNQNTQCVWIDLDDVSSADDLFEQILHAIARKAGISEWMPVILDEPASAPREPLEERTRSRLIEDARIEEVRRLTNQPHRKWLVFLNARDGAGANFLGYRSKPQDAQSWPEQMPNGWLDWDGKSHSNGEPRDNAVAMFDEKRATGAAVADILRGLCRRGDERATCPNLTVVFLCHGTRVWDTGFLRTIRQKIEGLREPVVLDESCSDLNYNAAIENGKSWVGAEDHYNGTRQERLRFLYALTLANRTRFPAMLWSWAPHGTETTKEAESKKRHDQTTKWLDQLEMKRVIRTKPGGFIWMHCAVRDNLRAVLYELIGSDSGDLTVEIHHGFAEWYRKLLLTSEDIAAAFDSIYHRCKRLPLMIDSLCPGGTPLKGRWLKEASEDACFNFWLSEIRNDLAAIAQMLSLSKNALLRSGFSKGNCRRLDALRSQLLRPIEESISRLKGAKLQNELFSLVDRIHFTSLRLNRAIAREVAENSMAFKRHAQLLYYKRTEKRNKRSKRPLFDVIWRRLRESAPRNTDGHIASAYDSLLSLETSIERGTLGIGARSYKYTKAIFDDVYKFLDILPLMEGDADVRYAALISRWVSSRKPEHRRAVVYRLIKVLQRDQQLNLVYGHTLHVLHHRNSNDSDIKAREMECFEKGSRCYRAAIELQRFLTHSLEQDVTEPRLSGSDESWFQNLFDDRQRLETQSAVIQAFRDRDFIKAHRRLSEAEASQQQSGRGSTSIERAIIELHRAEVFTHQVLLKPSAESPSLLEDEHTFLGTMRRKLLSRVSEARDIRDLSNLIGDTAGTQVSQDYRYRSERSFLVDGMQALDRAEVLLARNRKNVWWNTWFFELRMKLVELRLFAAIGVELDYPLPFLGSESAARGTPALPDRIVDNARRMIRLDVFRLARVVESYANCLLVLCLWRLRVQREIKEKEPGHLDIDRECDALKWRQQAMRRMLERHRAEVESRLDWRGSLDRQFGYDGNNGTSLDLDVRRYVEHVIKYCKSILDLTSEWSDGSKWPAV